MNYEILLTEPFKRKAKKLQKKYRSFKRELEELTDSLKENPKQGTPLGKNCFKVRLAISS